MLRPSSSTCAPYAAGGHAAWAAARPRGMKTVDLMPSSWAASATPWAWLPALAATTPRAFSSSREPGHPRVGAADLERAGALEVLALEEHLAAGPVGQRPAVLQRGRTDDAAEQLPGGEDVLEGHGHRR